MPTFESDKSYWRFLESVIGFWRTPILISDSHANLSGSNVAGKRLLERGRILKESSGRVVANSQPDTVRLHDSIVHLTHPRSARTFAAITFPTIENGRAAVILYAIRPAHAVAEPCHVLLNVIESRQNELLVGRGVLKELFGLTEAEERIALLVGQGYSPQQLVQHLRVSMPTIRTHLSHIYGKTQSRSQRDFLRLIGTLGILETKLGTE